MVDTKQTTIKEKQIGEVVHYYGKIKVAVIKLKGSLKVGDKIHVTGGQADDFTQTVKSMQQEHESIVKASKGQEIGLQVSKKVHEGDLVYLAA